MQGSEVPAIQVCLSGWFFLDSLMVITNERFVSLVVTGLVAGRAAHFQWLFLVPVKGGRDYITSQKAICKWYISGIYC